MILIYIGNLTDKTIKLKVLIVLIVSVIFYHNDAYIIYSEKL